MMRRLALACVFCVAAIAALPVAASAEPSRRIDVSERVDPRSIEATRQFWTPQRMRAADDRELAAATWLTDPLAAIKSKGWRGASADSFIDPPDTPGEFTIGRLYSVRNGGYYACSATLVKSANRSVIWTAGHCVHTGKGGEYDKRISFVLAAQPAGVAPFGIWPAVSVVTSRAWVRAGRGSAIQGDIAGVVVARNPAGQTVTDVVGYSQRLAFGSVPQKVSLYGYPASNDDNLTACPGRPVGRSPYRHPGKGPRPLIVRCEMRGGSSGGPWLARVGPDRLGRVIGVISLGYYSRDYLATPVLGATARAIFKRLGKVAV